MATNPFIRLYDAPVATLTDAAFALVLLAALVGTWWALGRNALYLRDEFQNGWLVLVPFWYCVRVVGALVILAVDLALVAAIIDVIA